MSELLQDTLSLMEEDDPSKLRAKLLAGNFGEEDVAGNRADTEADDEVVNNFISMFGAKGETPLKAHDWVAYVPSTICRGNDYWGPLFGIIREETESIYIFDSKFFENDEYVAGYIDNGSYQARRAYRAFRFATDKHLIGVYIKNDLALKLISESVANIYSPLQSNEAVAVDSNGQIHKTVSSNTEDPFADYYGKQTFDVRIKPYDTVTNLFSRNTGLLESSIMLDKRAVLVGCGSVGSFVAMELARSGVGKFVLCDTDTLEIHNICRHQCGFDDLGRYKVDAVRDKILNINPNAEVVTYRSLIQRIPEEELLPLLGRDTIIIGGGDNRASADWACKLAIKTDSAFISTGCWTRAFAGEIFYWVSGRNLACYSCALGGLIDDERPQSHATYFGSDEEKESLSFEPGVAADIDFVTIIAVKLALDLLNRDNDQYTPRVINYLKQYTWVCNTNNPKIGGERAAIFPTPLWITNNLSVHRDENCEYCGNKAGH